MTWNYRGLWKILIERDLDRTDFIEKHINNEDFKAIKRRELIHSNTLNSLCSLLDCDVSNIVESDDKTSAGVLSEEDIDSFLKIEYNIDWAFLCQHAMMDEYFMRVFRHQLHWGIISEYQRLSEEFIYDFQKRVDWKKIARYQRLSEGAISDFSKNFDWHEDLAKNPHISDDFKRQTGLI